MTDQEHIGLPIDHSSSNSVNNMANTRNSAAAGSTSLLAGVLPPPNPASLSSSSLANRAAEAELQRRVDSLRQQLQQATESLQKLKERPSVVTSSSPSLAAATAATAAMKVADSDDSDEHHGANVVAAAALLPPIPPPSKRGYLFKWLDRSMGWVGTKWALRFVVLEHGRMSYYGSHSDTSSAPRYVLQLRGCAVRDDGWKRNQRHPSFVKSNKKKNKQLVQLRSSKNGVDIVDEDAPPLTTVGAYFFLFSIYLRGRHDETDDDEEIVPLLRFSTNSLAEKTQWISLISETCAYCETEAYEADERARAVEAERQLQQQRDMTNSMPEAKEGTLPPLYFAPPIIKKKRHSRRPSFTRTPSSKLFRSKSQNIDAEKVDARSTKGYPPSKPMHRSAGPSYLSADAPVQNYRGLFNLGIIMLLVSNYRLLEATILAHGFVFKDLVQHVTRFRHLPADPWEDAPFVSGFFLLGVFLLITYTIERLLSRKVLNETVGMMLHHANAHTSLAVSIWIVWSFVHHPATGAALLLHGTITWMKILSYALANEDYRLQARRHDVDSHKAALVMVEDLDGPDEQMTYADNVTLSNLLYFWFAPTLTYQMAFPKATHIRWWRVAAIVFRMILVFALFTFLSAQVVSPALEGIIADLEETHGTYTVGILTKYWLKLCIANTYLWLLMFYFYFHLNLNLWAELLRFGDRVFYKDWWNSSELGAYWRLWNIPVHYWLIRHLYFPLVRLKLSRATATLLVFSFSAVMHEVLVSVPFHMVRPWSFLGMMMQVPLVAITKYLHRRYPGSSWGNVIFWLAFCVVGQPMAILLYRVDYEYAQHRQQEVDLEIFGDQEECRVMFREYCLIR